MNAILQLLLTDQRTLQWGKTGENNAVCLAYDLSAFLAAWPDGTPAVAFRRADGQEYAHAWTRQGHMLLIPLLLADTEKSGLCAVTLSWIVGEDVAKTAVFYGQIAASIAANGAPPTDIQQGIIEQTLAIMESAVEQATATAQKSASSAQADAAQALSAQTAAATCAAQAKNDAAKVRAIVAGNEAYMKRESDSLFSPVIALSAPGKFIQASNSADRPLLGLTLYGKTTQEGTPAPDAPAPLVNAGNDGSITARIAGKNLMPMPTQSFTSNGVTFAVQSDGSIQTTGTSTNTVNYMFYGRSVSRGYAFVLPAGAYVMSMTDVSGNAVGSGGFGIRYWTESAPDTAQIVQRSSSNTVMTFTLSEKSHVLPFFYFGTGAVTNKTIRVQIERGSATTAWEACKGGSVTVSTLNGLPGIPVNSGGNYTDDNGQMWLCDEIDLERGVYIQRVGRATLNGTENTWSLINTGGCCQVKLPHAAKATSYDADPSANILCDTLPPLPRKTVAETSVNGVSPSSTHLYVRLAGITTMDEMKAWVAATPTTLVYIPSPAIAIETALSAEEIAAYEALVSYKPVTTAINDAGAGQKLAYVADTQTYIDQKIAALSAAIVNAQ